MKKVTAIGGVFFKCNDPEVQKNWYAKHLGIAMAEYGSSFEWRHSNDKNQKGYSVWSPFTNDTDYFGAAEQQFMINYRVDDLEALVTVLKANGVTIVDQMEIYEYGKFIHILDAEGNRVELWEPNDLMYERMVNAVTK
ncbi:MAG: VOC family protein [Bacteroidetes bacterium]|nr:VOC family protein [Bacteroidota bacterium]